MYIVSLEEIYALKTFSSKRDRYRPWHDVQAIARTRAVTRVNQEK